MPQCAACSGTEKAKQLYKSRAALVARDRAAVRVSGTRTRAVSLDKIYILSTVRGHTGAGLKIFSRNEETKPPKHPSPARADFFRDKLF